MKAQDLDADAEHDKDETLEKELLEVARKRFAQAQEADQQQREREKDDLRFQVPENQWDDAAKRQRMGSIGADGSPVPARPIISISRIGQPIQMVLNQERAAHLGVSIQPLSADADVETAKVLEGIYRRIERDSQAHIARSWAFSRAVKCGRGAYRINTQYDETTDDPFDQTITIERILHQESVYFDPAATKPDCSDGNFAFIAQWTPLSDFEAQFPEAKIVGDELGTFADLVNDEPEWVRGDGEQAAVLVVEYFWKVKTFEEVKSKNGKAQRKRERVEVKRALLTGFEVLEQGDWNGKYIPIIPAIGQELHPYDEERRWEGIIGPAKDAQKLYNFAASATVERVALEPRAPFVGYAEQFEGFEDEWQQSNTRNFPYIRHKLVLVNGAPLPPPQRAIVDSNGTSLSMQLLQQADQFLQVTTATYDPALGRMSSREKSGKAIMALQQQGEEGNSHFMHNLADVSMAYEAKVVLDLIPTIYDRPGRITRTLDEEDESDTVMLNAPFIREPGSRRPIPAPPMGPPGMPRSMPPAGMMAGPSGNGQPVQAPAAKKYDLRKGTYSVAVSIGKTRQSALQEGAEEIGQILQAQPQLMPIIGPLYFKYRDFPGAKEISDLLAKMRDKQFPGLSDNDEEGPTVAQAQAKVSALEQQLQMMQEQLQGAIKALETEQIKQQATLQKAQMEQAAGLQKAQLESDTKVQVESIKQETQLLLKSLEGKLEQILQAQKIGHETVMAEENKKHEAVMSATATAPAPMPEWTGPNSEPLENPSEV